MDKKRNSSWLTDEVAGFLSQCPSQDALMAYRPSARAQKRLQALQAKSEIGSLTADEEWELDQFEHLEILLQSIKARLRVQGRAVMNDEVSVVLRAVVRDRAHNRCEYCWLHEDDAWETHQPDHVISRNHRGETAAENLAWTCAICNRRKGSDIASIDDATGRVVRLFHPRRDRWTRHFRVKQGRMIPLTVVGTVTEFLLQLNRPDRVRVRQILHRKGLYPR